MIDTERSLPPGPTALLGADAAPSAIAAGGEPDADAEDPPELVIRPRRGWIGLDWAELYRSRELLYFLTWRDVKIRYKQTVLGVAWAVLQPLFMMAIFTFVFGRFAGIPSDGFPYAVFVFAGLLPWTFFANGRAQGGQCLVNQQQMLTKIYFPRLYVPTAAVGAFLVDLAIAFGLYALILAVYRVPPAWTVVLLPLPVALTILATLGFAYTLSALTILYRDFRYVIPFMVQALMYVSPVIYPVSLLPTRFQWVLAINPMTGIIEAYRSAILGRRPGTCRRWPSHRLDARPVRLRPVLLPQGRAPLRRRRLSDLTPPAARRAAARPRPPPIPHEPTRHHCRRPGQVVPDRSEGADVPHAPRGDGRRADGPRRGGSGPWASGGPRPTRSGPCATSRSRSSPARSSASSAATARARRPC